MISQNAAGSIEEMQERFLDEEVKQQVESEIVSLFEINLGTTNEITFWEAFKAYIMASILHSG